MQSLTPILRNITETDAPKLRQIAKNCYPLDVHTPYTYWVLCKFYSKSCYMLTCNGDDIGFISSINTDNSVFIWQIGILKEYREKKYSHLLIDAVVKYADSLGKKVQVSIAEENKISYHSFNGYCMENNIQFKPSGSLSISDLSDPDFNESEIIYDFLK